MTDIYHWWGSDVSFGAGGDLLTVSGVEETNQRILRGLLTAAPEYLFHATYGAALGQHVGDALSPEDYTAIKAGIRQVVLSDPNVQPAPAPTFNFSARPDGTLAVSVTYMYRPSGSLQTLSFSVSK